MKLTFSASVIQFDKDKFLTAVQVEIRRAFIKAGRKFLLASVQRIPIWTGMARGALRNLEDLFGQVSGGEVRTQRPSSQSGPVRNGYYYNGLARTPELGRSLSTPTDQILSLTGASLATGRSAFYFRFNVDIEYFNVLDAVKWGAMKAGADAFEDYIKNNLNLPNPLTFTTRKIYKVT